VVVALDEEEGSSSPYTNRPTTCPRCRCGKCSAFTSSGTSDSSAVWSVTGNSLSIWAVCVCVCVCGRGKWRRRERSDWTDVRQPIRRTLSLRSLPNNVNVGQRERERERERESLVALFCLLCDDLFAISHDHRRSSGVHWKHSVVFFLVKSQSLTASLHAFCAHPQPHSLVCETYQQSAQFGWLVKSLVQVLLSIF
jgi:hypothetical protein